MLIKNWMSKPPITIEAEACLTDAIGLLRQHEISMLPVLADDQLVGIVTDRDIKKASASDVGSLEAHELLDLISGMQIKTIMTKNPITVPYNYTIEETALKLLVHNISGVPVLNQVKQLIGVITKTDIFRALISLTGIRKKGAQFAFDLQDRPGSIQEITDTMRDYGAHITSILTSYDRVREGHRRAYIRIYGMDRPSLQRLIEVLKEKTAWLYIVDHEENRREVVPGE
jgi:acetoin utilization protein AcuB